MFNLNFFKKKNGELSLEMLVKAIIALFALVVIIYFIVVHYSSNTDTLIGVGSNTINSAKDMK